MRLGRVLYPIYALGPGERLGLWLQGCERKCPGCANPELQPFEGKEVPKEMVLAMCRAAIKDYALTGISVTGGEPLLQAEELVWLLDGLKDFCDDVLLFTGFTLNEIREEKKEVYERLLERVSVLVDGEYRQEENHGEILKGSSNQIIHFLDENKKEQYEEYIKTDRRIIDSFAAQDGIVSVGIHPAGFLSKE